MLLGVVKVADRTRQVTSASKMGRISFEVKPVLRSKLRDAQKVISVTDGRMYAEVGAVTEPHSTKKMANGMCA